MNQNNSYKVLARKYRPNSFKDFIGQENLVRILNNSINLNKIPHAILLSGIRGIGKTTTARIIAKMINCTDLRKGDVVEACNNCKNCLSVFANTHPDIIEMDAASKTGIADIREIIENANYLPILGKYKIYIIDEIHMLSNNAFNALLKTLEEPPAHVIFIFATTEVKKLPITILSRCQKFDLKRLDSETLLKYLLKIAEIENINIEEQALKIIVNNSEGSVRDSLSLLDQAKNLSDNIVTSFMVNEMLGYGDITVKYDLLENIIKGNTTECLNIVKRFYYEGYDLILLFTELLELINEISKFKIIGKDANIIDYELNRLNSITELTNIASLSTLWQMIIKMLPEIREAVVILTAAEMVIIRLCYSAKLPSPIEIIEKFSNNSQIDQGNNSSSNIRSLNNFSDLIELCKNENELILYNYLVKDVQLISLKNQKIEISIVDDNSKDLTINLAKFLYNQTKQKWNIKIIDSENIDTIEKLEQNKHKQEKLKFSNHPIYKSILENFGSATIKEIRRKTIH